MRSTHPFAPAGFLLLCASLAGAQSVPPDLALEVVTDAVVAPIGVRAPNDGSGRLFILSQAGTIRIVKDGVLLPAPFLTVPVILPLLLMFVLKFVGAIFVRFVLSTVYKEDFRNEQ